MGLGLRGFRDYGLGFMDSFGSIGLTAYGVHHRPLPSKVGLEVDI